MNKDRYPVYGVGIVAAAGVAVWMGLSPSFLLVVLVCPLMMFFMMRGMNGAQRRGDDPGTPSTSDLTVPGAKSSGGSSPTDPRP